MSNKNRNILTDSTLLLLHFCAFAIFFISIELIILIHFNNFKIIHQQCHTLIESIDALSSIILASFIIIMWKSRQLHSSYIFFASSLMSTGSFNLIHASILYGESFTWLHCMSTLSGGLIFSLIFINKHISKYFSLKFLPCIFGSLSFLFGILSVFYPRYIPCMFNDNYFSYTANLMNIIGGICFFLAWLYFFLFKSNEMCFTERLLLANHCLLFGTGGLMFPFSHEWDASWWLWHMLRMCAYVLILIFFLYRYSQDAKKIQINQLELQKRTQELEQTKMRLSDIIEYSPCIITLKDTEGKFIIINKEFTRVFGYCQDDIVGKTAFDVFKESADLISEKENKVINSRHVTQNEECRKINGIEKTFIVGRFPLVGSENKIYGICCTMTDITKRKNDEIERKNLLCENEKRIKEINCLYEISKLLDNYELGLEDIFKGMVNFIFESLSDEYSGVKIIYDNYEAENYSFEETEWIHEVKVIVDGTVKGYIQLFYINQSSTLDNKLQEEQHFFKELSIRLGSIIKQKMAEKALRNAFEFNDKIIEEFPVGLAIFDQDGTCIAANSSMESMTGLGRKYMLGQNYNNVDFWKKNGLCEVAEESILIKRNKRHQFNISDQQGHIIFFECLFVPFTLHDEFRLLFMIDNISDHKKAEEQLKVTLSERESLLQEIHHRVKNNMQIAASLLFLQSQNIENTEAIEALQDSQDRIKSMGLVHELLYRSANFSKISFKDYIEALVQSLKVSYNIYNKISIVVECEGIELPVDSAIPCGLIVNELISNSFKHAFKKNNSGMIAISFIHETDHYVLSVQDNGSGLPEGYDRESSSTLGLSLVRTLTAQLAGTVNFINDNGLKCIISF